ncbi:MAG TPA: polysaccharide biosynthesis/export family protein [Prosthecobacter sp.]|nr:polysaccharide biosynthesis/export family protein [Prosthecobacter sp.]
MRTLLIFLLLLSAPAAFAQSGELPLRPGDKITISIGAIPDNEVMQIKGVYTISDNGTVNLLHIGEVRATGLKPSMFQRTIEQTYIAREIYTRPNVLVSIDGGDATTRQVYVTGVQKPGPVPFRQGMTISRAIQFAGGPTPFSSMRKVRLTRGNRTTEHNLSKGMGNPSIDVMLQPDDQINLPE